MNNGLILAFGAALGSIFTIVVLGFFAALDNESKAKKEYKEQYDKLCNEVKTDKFTVEMLRMKEEYERWEKLSPEERERKLKEIEKNCEYLYSMSPKQYEAE